MISCDRKSYYTSATLLSQLDWTYLDNLLILHTSHEDILLISIGVILDHIRDFTIREYLNTFSSLGIPLFDISIVRRR